MPPPNYAIEYLVNGLSASPLVLSRLSKDVSAPQWDERLDPDRFTLREALAHVGDWEAIWLSRISRMRTESMPFLQNVDETELSKERNYGASDPLESLRRYREGRVRVLELLRSLRPEEWERKGDRERAGVVTLFQLAVIILGHDAYHLKQFAQALGE